MEDKIDVSKYREIKIWDILGLKMNRKYVLIRCPFHSDSTPSCAIYDSNSWYCFGCKSKGKGAIDFTMALGYTFKESINELDKLIHR